MCLVYRYLGVNTRGVNVYGRVCDVGVERVGVVVRKGRCCVLF